MTAAAGLVTVVVGELGRASGARARSPRTVGAGVQAPAPATQQWSCHWGTEGPGTLSEGCDGEPALTLSIGPDDARLVREGELAPSVAFMQGRLKTSGDNALLLKVLAWTATPAFQAALSSWGEEKG